MLGIDIHDDIPKIGEPEHLSAELSQVVTLQKSTLVNVRADYSPLEGLTPPCFPLKYALLVCTGLYMGLLEPSE